MKEIIKQFSGTIYKFEFCEGRVIDGTACYEIHVYERRCVRVEPYQARWFYIGDLENEANKPPITVEKHDGNT